MSLETNTQQKENNRELALETFIQIVSERRKREALNYYWAQLPETQEYIKRNPQGNMYLKEASLWGI